MPTLTERQRKLAGEIKSQAGQRNLQKQYRKLLAEWDYVEKGRSQLLEQYKNQWIAVYEKKVIAHGGHLQELIDRLYEMGLDLGQVVIQYMTDKPPTMLL